MPKKSEPPKETVAPKAKAMSESSPVKRKVSRGDSLVCGVCGMSVVVEEAGNIAVVEESPIICCGIPMKQRTSARAKAAKK